MIDGGVGDVNMERGISKKVRVTKKTGRVSVQSSWLLGARGGCQCMVRQDRRLTDISDRRIDGCI
jgi:hypothetical protein